MELVRVRTAAAFLAQVEVGDCRHLVLGQFEAEYIEVLRNALRVSGLGEHYDAVLQVPTDDDLGRGDAVFLSRLGNCVDLEEVRLALAQWAPSLDFYAVGAEGVQLALTLQVRVQFYLVYHRGDGGVGF